MIRDYETVSEAVNDLKKRGYTADLSMEAERDCLVCRATATELSPEDFEIDEVYRFEGMTDPGDEMIVYAISSKNKEVKGIVVNAFGIYSSYRASKLVEHLTKHHS
ncbi:phosphoribosylpyrophosphate synthetase [Fluviicola chungangensis]|uniref:Phosphoribosylpyrophosphate synthetase n=1 Tax=Fluviicola chungangensis TaxID=2597671 RepID=A0A556N0C5_9FLAO|nr:phosphoribosylpyrophosphate synthetase [Fluviicola chungangensis]TSJ45479.1 phosphoribosylpyrophosphate synthetase [Fluviicola chungangensis]